MSFQLNLGVYNLDVFIWTWTPAFIIYNTKKVFRFWEMQNVWIQVISFSFPPFCPPAWSEKLLMFFRVFEGVRRRRNHAGQNTYMGLFTLEHKQSKSRPGLCSGCPCRRIPFHCEVHIGAFHNGSAVVKKVGRHQERRNEGTASSLSSKNKDKQTSQLQFFLSCRYLLSHFF